jgi:hypothetical protein
VRDLEGGARERIGTARELFDLSAQDAQARASVGLGARLEQDLKPQANPEVRFSGEDLLFDCVA